jgi:hypothetical protein
MLKRRKEKLEPRRKLERLKRNVLPPQCFRRPEGPLSVVVLVLLAVDPSTVATADVVLVTGTAESRVIALSPHNIRKASRQLPRLIPFKPSRNKYIYWCSSG